MSDLYTTNDLSIAAYLLMKGQKIQVAERSQVSGKFVFKFENKDKICEKLSIDFLSSECCAYDGFVRTLRGLLSKP